MQSFVVGYYLLFVSCRSTFSYILWFTFDPNAMENFNSYLNALRSVGFIFSYTNSCINPIAFNCVSTSFRKHCNRLMCCCKTGDSAESISECFCRRSDGGTAVRSHFNNCRRTIVVASIQPQNFRMPGSVVLFALQKMQITSSTI